MNKGLAERVKISSHAPINVYISSGNGRFFWPYRLQPVHESYPGGRRQCLSYILDSGFRTPDEITDADIIERAQELNASYLIPNDEPGDIRTTCERVQQFLNRVRESQLSANVFIPLQPPYQEHYRLLEQEYPEQARRSRFCLGGIKDWDPDRQLDALKQAREAIGWNAHFHALGLGGSLRLIRGFRDNPGIIDSLDMSTPEKLVNSGQLADRSWEPTDFNLPRGTDSSTITAIFVSALTLQLAYMLSPLCSEKELEEPETELVQQAISDVIPCS